MRNVMPGPAARAPVIQFFRYVLQPSSHDTDALLILLAHLFAVLTVVLAACASSSSLACGFCARAVQMACSLDSNRLRAICSICTGVLSSLDWLIATVCKAAARCCCEGLLPVIGILWSASRSQPERKMSTSTSVDRSQVSATMFTPSCTAAVSMDIPSALTRAIIDCILMLTKGIAAAMKTISSTSTTLRAGDLLD